jgi:acyl-coenzyme A synthetase/AMP-(fatty) acid ligase
LKLFSALHHPRFTFLLQNEPERTAFSYRGDYYVTGDRGYQDEDGYFYFVSRSDDIIISAGYRIGPFEVESALIEHPAVLESAVVSSPDKTRGEVRLKRLHKGPLVTSPHH